METCGYPGGGFNRDNENCRITPRTRVTWRLEGSVESVRAGIHYLFAQTEHAPFDLVAYKQGKFRRVQVKHRALGKNGALEIKFSTCWTDRRGTHTAPIDKGEIDIFCVYCPDTDECYYLEPGKYGSNVSLRVETAKNGQAKGVKFANDFRRVP